MTRTRTTGHLFAGIDGFGLGLSEHHFYAVGGGANLLPHFETAWTIEYADFPRSILELREPRAEHLRDVLEVTNPPKVDVLTGGFPCQDLSLAGKGAGIGGRRSGLWGQYARIVGEVEPELVLIENVPALLHRGFELVVRDLVELGYRVEWDCLPAAAFGAPHLRDRVWIAAHRHDQPVIFGQPAALFPMLPEGAADLVGTDGDDDGAASSWHRWPRAGWVDGDPELVMPLEPLARVSDVRAGRRLWPTPMTSNRKSRKAMLSSTGNGRRAGGANSSPPGLEQAVELAAGITPRELEGIDTSELPPATRALWPTPVASDSAGSRRATARTDAWTSHPGTTLLDAVSAAEGIVWPTPQAADGKGGRNESAALDEAEASGRSLGSLRRPSGAKASVSLRTAVEADRRGLWPTPRASGGHDSGGGETGTYRRTPSQQAGKHGLYLQSEAIEAELDAGRLTEADVDQLRGQGGTTAGALNPEWVEWLMGFPLGWTDPDVANDALRFEDWTQEPDGVPRVAIGTPNRGPRLTALGNALVPAAPAWLAARYLAATDHE